MGKHLTIFFVLLLMAVKGFGQDTLTAQDVFLKVTDPSTNRPIVNAHIINQNNASGTTTDTSGYFSLYAKPGHKLFVSAIGYQFNVITIDGSMFDQEQREEVALVPRSYVLPEVTIYELSTYEEFKEGFMDADIEEMDEDLFVIPVFDIPEIPELLNPDVFIQPFINVSIPLGAVLSLFNRKSNKKTAYFELVRALDDKDPDVVADLEDIKRYTGLDDMHLDKFMEFSGLHQVSLSDLTEYELLFIIQRDLEDFKEMYGLE